ncbi:FUSC family protein [Microbacterium xanthum]|uniref:FUSC family protein n=1 Tax=Microbacterium xanthum TaxID=3079794 RepID=UPI002AD49004|nr:MULTISPECIES: FUSC family protein [unclassified Microbacterium]MDZ8172601.1 FUSC family protein [Microbacterium sp. KSW-48]MDZ8202562.1 FUSC family protein [Microbacterium sp. SSW1-59]
MALPISPGRLALLVAAVLAPLVVVAATPLSSALGATVLGVIATAGSIRRGAPAMWRMAGSSAIVSLLAGWTATTGDAAPVIGTALVVLASLATSALPRHGLTASGGMVVTIAALLVIKPVSMPVDTVGAWAGTVLVALTVGATTAWIAAILSVALRGHALPRPELPTPTVPYSILLAVLAGGFTFVSLTVFPDSNAWWTVLTVAIILQPTRDELWSKLGARVLGTLLGGALAAVIAVLLPTAVAPAALGLVALGANVVLTVRGAPYWQSATAVTVTVVMLTFDRGELLQGDLQRILFTVLAAATTAAAVALLRVIPPTRATRAR